MWSAGWPLTAPKRKSSGAAGLPLDSYFLGYQACLDPAAQRRSRSNLHRQGKLRLGTTDAFFLQHLTGRCVTDITTASRTSLMNLDSGQWDEELCRLFNVPIDDPARDRSYHR